MSQIVKSMGGALEAMDMERVAKVMEAFEKQFEDLDVQSAYVEQAMDMSTATTTPEEEVDGLISQVADEYGLEVSQKLDAAGYVLVFLVFLVCLLTLLNNKQQSRIEGTGRRGRRSHSTPAEDQEPVRTSQPSSCTATCFNFVCAPGSRHPKLFSLCVFGIVAVWASNNRACGIAAAVCVCVCESEKEI